jgi:hypothetical protein
MLYSGYADPEISFAELSIGALFFQAGNLQSQDLVRHAQAGFQ